MVSSCYLQTSNWSISLLWISISFYCRMAIYSSCWQHSRHDLDYFEYIIITLAMIISNMADWRKKGYELMADSRAGGRKGVLVSSCVNTYTSGLASVRYVCLKLTRGW